MATAAYSGRRSLSGDSIVGAPQDSGHHTTTTSAASLQACQTQGDKDEDELVELEGEDDEMEDRKSIEDGNTSVGGSPRKGLSFEDELAQSLSNAAPKTQVTKTR